MFPNKFIEPPNLASVNFSIAERKVENLLLVSFKVVFTVCLLFKSDCKAVTFCFFTETNASTQDDVSKPDAKPLNDIVDAIAIKSFLLTCKQVYIIYTHYRACVRGFQPFIRRRLF